jgi:hypothetical protein
MDGYKVTTWPAFVEDLGMVSINGKAPMKLKRSTINHIGNHSYSFASGPSVAVNGTVVLLPESEDDAIYMISALMPIRSMMIEGGGKVVHHLHSNSQTGIEKLHHHCIPLPHHVVWHVGHHISVHVPCLPA